MRPNERSIDHLDDNVGPLPLFPGHLLKNTHRKIITFRKPFTLLHIGNQFQIDTIESFNSFKVN